MANKKKKKRHIILKTILLIITLGLFVYAYGTYIEPKQLMIKENKIVSNKITDNFDGFKIVGISDIHYGKYYTIKDLNNLVTTINSLNPDIVVFTGDLIDKTTKMTTSKADKIASELNKISASSGKYIINGENDIKFDEWENIITNGGFINLNNNYDTIYQNSYDSILIAGLSTSADKEAIINKNQKTMNYINSFEKGGPIFNILLIHEPDYIDELEDNKFDLILSGHSHNSQINVPFIRDLLSRKGAVKYNHGHYKIDTSDLYVSSGIGTTNFNFRIFNTPSIDVYRLIQGKKSK